MKMSDKMRYSFNINKNLRAVKIEVYENYIKVLIYSYVI